MVDPMVIVRSKIKEVVGNMSVSSDFPDALNQEVIALIRKAKKRAEDNNRKTMMPKDI